MGKLEKLLSRAVSDTRAVVAFNAVDPTSMWAILRGAEAADAPVVVQVSERVAAYWGPEFVADTFAALRRTVSVEAVLHLDHCRSTATAQACLESGWDSVLLDASRHGFEQAVAVTRQVVARATELGADVEGEFDPIPASTLPDPMPLSAPDDCATFVRLTGVCCLAPALGTGHGRPGRRPRVDLALTREIADATGVPLVLHGGTGLESRHVRSAVRAGVAKVNVSTALKERYLATCANTGERSEPLQLVQDVRSGVESVVREWIGGVW